MLYSTYNPPNMNDFQKQYLSLNGLSVMGTAAHGSDTTLDLLLTDDMLITDGVLLASMANWGDTVDFQVVAPMGFSNPNVAGGITFGADTVLLQPLTGWVMNPQTVAQGGLMANYPAKLYGGLILRIVYHSTGGTNVSVGANYKLHKVLV